MHVSNGSKTRKEASLLRYILLAGITAGFLDAAAASIQYFIRTGRNPERVFQFIASGVFGKEAFNGGLFMSAWGLIFHFIIAFLFTLFFFFLASRIKVFLKRPLISGLLYGIFVWMVMNLVVVPLSNTPKIPFSFSRALVAALILIVAVGLPVSLIASMYHKRKEVAAFSGDANSG